MLLGIGTDIVRVSRFGSWREFSRDQLLRIFSSDELSYCKSGDSYNLSRLAARFAAKEALFKALSAALVKLKITKNEFSLLFLCKHVEVRKTTWEVPDFKINWKALEGKIEHKLPNLCINLSLSHEKEHAIAFVVISRWFS